MPSESRRAVRTGLAAALLATSAACASATAARPAPFPGAQPNATSRPVAAVPAVPPAGLVAAVQAALDLRGTTYTLGGESPSSGFDCSGLVQYVLAQQGYVVPRTVAEQVHIGRAVSLDEIQPGDLVFFITEGRSASHVGLVVDGLAPATFVHAPGSGGVVRVDRLSSVYWRDRFAGARRMW